MAQWKPQPHTSHRCGWEELTRKQLVKSCSITSEREQLLHTSQSCWSLTSTKCPMPEQCTPAAESLISMRPSLAL